MLALACPYCNPAFLGLSESHTGTCLHPTQNGFHCNPDQSATLLLGKPLHCPPIHALSYEKCPFAKNAPFCLPLFVLPLFAKNAPFCSLSSVCKSGGRGDPLPSIRHLRVILFHPEKSLNMHTFITIHHLSLRTSVPKVSK